MKMATCLVLLLLLVSYAALAAGRPLSTEQASSRPKKTKAGRESHEANDINDRNVPDQMNVLRPRGNSAATGSTGNRPSSIVTSQSAILHVNPSSPSSTAPTPTVLTAAQSPDAECIRSKKYEVCSNGRYYACNPKGKLTARREYLCKQDSSGKIRKNLSKCDAKLCQAPSPTPEAAECSSNVCNADGQYFRCGKGKRLIYRPKIGCTKSKTGRISRCKCG